MYRAHIAGVIISAILLACPVSAKAQHHGGHGMGGGIPGASGRPDGVDEKDTLKDFHQALAVQATSQQIAEFQNVVNATNAAKDKLNAFAEGKNGREGITPLDQSLENARSATKKFEEGFSPAQKSGLKDTAKRLEKADSDLAQEAQHLDQSVQGESANSEIAAHAAATSKALSDLANVQLALGREMGITLASGQDLSFNFPQVRNNAVIADRTISVGTSGVLSQTTTQGDLRSFNLEMTLDLSDLQQSISEVMNGQLSEAKSCGERLSVRQAAMVAAASASSLTLKLHFERWSCSRAFGSLATELGEGEGTVEFRLTSSVGTANALKITATIKRIDAAGMMGEELRSGDLGTDLSDKVAKAILTAVQTGADFKTTMPGAVQNTATLQTARFQDSGAGGLKVVLDGQMQLSNEQVELLARQLNQSLSAQGSPPH
jgi:hypothetical protein